MTTIFDKSEEGKTGTSFNEEPISGRNPEDELGDELLRSDDPGLPEISQPELIRHYTELRRGRRIVSARLVHHEAQPEADGGPGGQSAV